MRRGQRLEDNEVGIETEGVGDNEEEAETRGQRGADKD